MSEYDNLDPFTLIAIDRFKTLLRRERSVEKAKKELSKYTGLIPSKDVAAYVKITEEMENSMKFEA